MSAGEQAQLFRMCSIRAGIYSTIPLLPYCGSIAHARWAALLWQMLCRLTADTPSWACGFVAEHIPQPAWMGAGWLLPPPLLQRDRHLTLFLRDSQGVRCLQVGKVQISEKQWTQTLLKITAFCCLRERRIHKPKGICLPFYGWLYHGEICQRNAIF